MSWKKRYKRLKKRHSILFREQPIVLHWGPFRFATEPLQEGKPPPIQPGLTAVKIRYRGEDYVLAPKETRDAQSSPPDGLCSRSTK
jgi:hypothetical protein